MKIKEHIPTLMVFIAWVGGMIGIKYNAWVGSAMMVIAIIGVSITTKKK